LKVVNLREEHSHIEAKAGTKSVTSEISVEKLIPELNPSSLEGEEIYIADCPGFGDTNGSEVDSANLIALSELIQGSDAIIPVLLWNSKGDDERFTTFKEFFQP